MRELKRALRNKQQCCVLNHGVVIRLIIKTCVSKIHWLSQEQDGVFQ